MTEEERRRLALQAAGFDYDENEEETPQGPFYPTGASDGMDWNNAQGVNPSPAPSSNLSDWEDRYASEHGFRPGEGNNATYREELATRFQSEDWAARNGRDPTDQDFISMYYDRGDEWQDYLRRADEAMKAEETAKAEAEKAATHAPVEKPSRNSNGGGGGGNYAEEIRALEAELAESQRNLNAPTRRGARQARQDVADMTTGNALDRNVTEPNAQAVEADANRDPRTGRGYNTRQDYADLVEGSGRSNADVYGAAREVRAEEQAAARRETAPSAVTRKEDSGQLRESSLSVQEEEAQAREGRFDPAYNARVARLEQLRALQREWEQEQAANLRNYPQDVRDAGLTEEQSAQAIVEDYLAQRAEETPPTRRDQVTSLKAEGGDSIQNTDVLPGWLRTIVEPMGEIPDVLAQAQRDIRDDPWDVVPGVSQFRTALDAYDAMMNDGSISQEERDQILADNDNPVLQMALGSLGRATEGVADLGAAVASIDADLKRGEAVDVSQRLSPEGGSQFAFDYMDDPRVQAEFRSRIREGMTPIEAARSLETWKSMAGEAVFDPLNFVGAGFIDDMAGISKIPGKIDDLIWRMDDSLLDSPPQAAQDFMQSLLDDLPGLADDTVQGATKPTAPTTDVEADAIASSVPTKPEFDEPPVVNTYDQMSADVIRNVKPKPTAIPRADDLVRVSAPGRTIADPPAFIRGRMEAYIQKYFGKAEPDIQSTQRFYVHLAETMVNNPRSTPAQLKVANDYLAFHRPQSIPGVSSGVAELKRVIAETPDDTATAQNLMEQIYQSTNGNYVPRVKMTPEGPQVVFRIRKPVKGNAYVVNLDDASIITSEVRVIKAGDKKPNLVGVQFLNESGNAVSDIKFIDKSRLRSWDGKYARGNKAANVTETAENIESATTKVTDPDNGNSIGTPEVKVKDVEELRRMRDVTEAEINALDKNSPTYRKARTSRINAFNRAAKKAGFEDVTFRNANEYIVGNGVRPKPTEPNVTVITGGVEDSVYRTISTPVTNRTALTEIQVAKLKAIQTEYTKEVQQLNPAHKDFTRKKAEITRKYDLQVRQVTGNNFHTAGRIDGIIKEGDMVVKEVLKDADLDIKNTRPIRSGWGKVSDKFDIATVGLRKAGGATVRATTKAGKLGAAVSAPMFVTGLIYAMETENGDELLSMWADEEGQYVQGILADILNRTVQERNQDGQMISRDERWDETAGDIVMGLANLFSRPAIYTQQFGTLAAYGLGIPLPGVDTDESRWVQNMMNNPNLSTDQIRAILAATRNGYSGTVKETYDAIMALPVKTDEAVERAVWANKNLMVDFLGEMFLDPTALLGMATDIKGAAMRGAGADLMGEGMSAVNRVQDAMATFGVRPMLDLLDKATGVARLPSARIGRELRAISNQVAARIEGATTREALQSLEDWMRSSTFLIEKGRGMNHLQGLDPDDFITAIRTMASRAKVPLTPERVAHFATIAAYDMNKADIMAKFGYGEGAIDQILRNLEQTTGKVSAFQKKILSPFLLTLSPRYHIRNFANNYATSLLDGWINYDTPTEIIRWWETHGDTSIPPMFREAWSVGATGKGAVGVSMTGEDLLKLENFNEEQVAGMRLQQAAYLDMFPRMWGAGLNRGTRSALMGLGIPDRDIAQLMVELSDLHNGAAVKARFNTWISGLSSATLQTQARRVMEDVTLPTFYRARAGTFGAAQAARDFSLFNYQDRYAWDALLEVVSPYQFWTTRSVWSWTQRMVENPEFLGTWVRMEEAFKNGLNANLDDDPDYLKNKPSLPTSANPYMGEAVAGMMDSLVTNLGIIDPEKVDKHGVYVNILATFMPIEDVFSLITDMGYDTVYPEDVDTGVRFASEIINSLPGTSPVVDAAVGILDRTIFANSKNKLREFHEPTAPIAARDILNPALRGVQRALNPTGTTEPWDLDYFYRYVMGSGAGKPDYVNRNVVRRLMEQVDAGELTDDEAIRALADEAGMTYEAAQEYVLGGYEARGRVSFATGLSVTTNPYGVAREVGEDYYKAMDSFNLPDGTLDFDAYNKYLDQNPAARLQPLINDGERRQQEAQISVIGDRSRYMDETFGAEGVDIPNKEGLRALPDAELRAIYEQVLGRREELGGYDKDQTRRRVEGRVSDEQEAMSERDYFEMDKEYDAFKTPEAKREYLAANPGFAEARRLYGERTETNPLFVDTPAMREQDLAEYPVTDFEKELLTEAGYTPEQIANMTTFEADETDVLQEYFKYKDTEERLAAQVGLTMDELKSIKETRDAAEERGVEGSERFEGIAPELMEKYYNYRDLIEPYEDWDDDGTPNAQDPQYKAEKAREDALPDYEEYNTLALEGSGLNQAQLDEIRRIRDENEENGAQGRERFEGVPATFLERYYKYNDMMQPYYDAQDAVENQASAEIWGMTPDELAAETSTGGGGGGGRSSNYNAPITVGPTAGASEGQVRFMVNMGIPQGVAEGLTKDEAKTLLNQIQDEALAAIGVDYRTIDGIMSTKEWGQANNIPYNGLDRNERDLLDRYYDAMRQAAGGRGWDEAERGQLDEDVRLEQALRLAGY